MNQFLAMLSHLSLQDYGAIVGIISGVVALFPQRGGVRNDTRVIVHYIQYEPSVVPEQLDNPGCVFRAFLYFVIIVCAVGLGISLLYVPAARSLSSPILSTQQAQALVQAFYDDVNKKDYRAAYSLTKDGFSKSYDQFVAGYRLTEHSSISFKNIEELSDGTVQVIIVIKANEKLLTGVGSTISYYRNTYIVSPDHGGSVILRGTSVRINGP